MFALRLPAFIRLSDGRDVAAADKIAFSDAGFRPDIEGLRALAVAAVVFYHLKFDWAPGGFVGVDVFFVISGFLMAQIIVKDIRKGEFSPWRFYQRRFLRIWPAMILVILATLVVGVIALVPLYLSELGKAALSSLVLANNVLFWFQSGYFAPAAENNILLHLWSLAVEQQFYLGMPFLMLAAFWHKPNGRGWVIASVAIASLLLCVVMTSRKPSASFYLLPTRVWEFLLGSMIAVYGTELRLKSAFREFIAVLGLALLIGSVVGLNRHLVFPGYWALVPCVGTAMMILGGMHGPVQTSHLLASAPFVTIGRISYSLYLWHWPVITFCRLWGLPIDTVPMQFSILAISLVTSFVSWRYVEVPFRSSIAVGRTRRLATVGASAAVIAAVSGLIIWSDGLPVRLDPATRALLAYERYPAKASLYRQGSCFLEPNQDPADFRLDVCTDAVPGRARILLWGDSHAAHYAPGMRAAAEKFGINITQASYGGCAPVPFRADNSAFCAAFGKKIWTLAVNGSFDAVVISANWAGYPAILPEVAKVVRDLLRAGQKVVVVGPSLEFRGNLPTLLASNRSSLFAKPPSSAHWLADYATAMDGKMRELFAGLPQALYISPIAEVCPQQTCPVLMDGAVPIAWDASSSHRRRIVIHGKRTVDQDRSRDRPTRTAEAANGSRALALHPNQVLFCASYPNDADAFTVVDGSDTGRCVRSVE